VGTALINGVRINYRQTGAGPDLVFIHGLGANQAFWNLGLITSLSRDYRVTTFDLPGHGYSETPKTGYRPADAAESLRALLDQLGVERAHAVGHSYGGLVALRLALTAPARVLTITIADTRVRSLQPGQALIEIADWPALRAMLARQGVTIDENEPEVGFMIFEALASPKWESARERIAEQSRYVPFGAAGTRSAQRWLKLLAATSIKQDYRAGADIPRDQLGRIKHPVLAIYGQNSPNHRTGEEMASCLQSCRLVTVPEASHFHPATHPEFFRETLLEVLSGKAVV
jgi:pimeloyl-ACP methyl ester carboxylesterase